MNSIHSNTQKCNSFDNRMNMKKNINFKKVIQNIKFIKTNEYMNNYNYFNKNAIKMNKLRQEKYKERKEKKDSFLSRNIVPKMLYSNKFLTLKRNFNSINPNEIGKYETISASRGNYNIYKKNIENAIFNKNLEKNRFFHIPKTINAFSNLIQYIDKVDKNKNDGNKLDDISNEDISDDLNIENYNFEEYKKKYYNLKNNNTTSRNDFTFPVNTETKNEIYLTGTNNIIKTKKNKDDKLNNSSEFSNNLDIQNSKKNHHELIIHKMQIISDDYLVKKIKQANKSYKTGLIYKNYGKYKFTELGILYPNSVKKYNKIKEYKGNNAYEKIIQKYKEKIANTGSNYVNIGTFNEKFNRDLSDISNYYGKSEAKGRFLGNPLVTSLKKYIPNYQSYKNIKFIENRYTTKNNYKFKILPLVNNKKNNFDKLANIIYKEEFRKNKKNKLYF